MQGWMTVWVCYCHAFEKGCLLILLSRGMAPQFRPGTSYANFGIHSFFLSFVRSFVRSSNRFRSVPLNINNSLLYFFIPVELRLGLLGSSLPWRLLTVKRRKIKRNFFAGYYSVDFFLWYSKSKSSTPDSSLGMVELTCGGYRMWD